MPAVGNPRQFRPQRFERQRLLAVANRDVSWSRPLLEDYCERRGIPLTAITDLPLGTDANAWDPGSNAAFVSTVVNELAPRARAINAHGFILGPGCPARVTVRGIFSSGSYSAGGLGYPPLAALVGGCISYASQLASLGGAIAAVDGGSGRWTWGNQFGSALWSGTPFVQVGATDPSLSPSYTLNDDAALAAYTAQLPTEACTALLGNSANRVLPVGRVGYSEWQTPAVAESSSNALASLALADLGQTADSLTGPVLVSIEDVSGTDGDIWAALYAQLVAWGFPAGYVYRSAPTGAQATYAPLAGATYTEAAWESSLVDVPYSALFGCCDNTDTPETAGVGFNTLRPGAGSGVGPLGASGGYEWALRQLTRGAAWGIVDQTHKNLGVHRAAWATDWLLLAGMSVMEACYWSGGNNSYLACGDPLAEPFRLYAAGAAPASATPVRRWDSRRRRAMA